ncbi:glycosyltransferase [Polymorphospora rubra]|uniref:glycosyltransferase n=1 Tax=Polymorphospora rubra TaxID=338584 RepID=UPI0033D2C233
MIHPVLSTGPRLVHVNTTATGGGVAEMLHALVRGQVAQGLRAGWVVIAGSPQFFALTKQMHHLLHGRGVASLLRDPEQSRLYRAALESQARWLVDQLEPGDTVVLHDPQTLGLAPILSDSGIRAFWHCHIGTTDEAEDQVSEVWRFFHDDLFHLAGMFAPHPAFFPSVVPADRRHIALPAIDPSSPKNRYLSPPQVDDLLARLGLTAPAGDASSSLVIQDGYLPPEAGAIVQISRWDPLKDMAGVMRCFAQLRTDAHLILAGADPNEIPDDPEGREVFADVQLVRSALSAECRARTHLVALSMRDAELSALYINALQRRADIVVQKSLEEGFGLTVTEAMAKARAVVGSNVGGIPGQITSEINGILVDPTGSDEVVAVLARLLDDPTLRRSLGKRAAAVVAQRYLMSRLVSDYGKFVQAVMVQS